MRTFILLGIFVSLAEPHAWAEPKATSSPSPREVQAKVFAPVFDGDLPLFRYTRLERVRPDGGVEFEGKYVDAEGKDAYLEKGQVDAQGGTVSYESTHLQVPSRSELRREGQFWRVSVTDEKGKTQTDQLPARAPLLVGPFVAAHLLRNQRALLEGKTLEFQIWVPMRMSAYGFQLKNAGAVEWEGRKVHRIEMKPTNLVFRAFVSTMVFYLDARAGQLAGYEGRSHLFFRKPGRTDWDPVEVKTVYDSGPLRESVLHVLRPTSQAAPTRD
jgi:hypothetical protein